MKFAVDAQLPRRMTAWLAAAGCDAVHTLDLPDGNRSPDASLSNLADRELGADIAYDARDDEW